MNHHFLHQKRFSINLISLIALVIIMVVALFPAPITHADVDAQSAVNITDYCPVIDRRGGINDPGWGNANDAADYNTTTNPSGGRWGNQTNETNNPTYQTVDLGAAYPLTAVGYWLDWDGEFDNSLAVQVAVSTDNVNWTVVSDAVYPHEGGTAPQVVDVDIALAATVTARYVRYAEPGDGAWNGWGDYFHLRAFSTTPSTTCYTRPGTVGDPTLPGCDVLMRLPKTAVVGSFGQDAMIYWKPGKLTSPLVTIQAGKTAWVLGVDESGQYRKIVWSCDYLWVKADALTPNFDAVWQGTPLPMDVVH